MAKIYQFVPFTHKHKTYNNIQDYINTQKRVYHSKNAAMRGLNSPRQVIVYIETETGSSSNGEITPT